MTMIRYFPKSKVGLEHCRVGKNQLTFNQTTLNGWKAVTLYYDSDSRQIGVEECKESCRGLTLTKKGGFATIHVAGFYKSFKLNFTQPTLKRIDKKDGMFIIQL